MEKRKKFKILKRILPIICAVLCIATVLSTPIMAIVDSSQGTNQNYDITGCSTFPMTVGLAFELDEGNNITFASDIGGYGQEYNTTQGGTDTFFWTSNASTATELEGQLEYEFLAPMVQDKEYRNSFPFMTNYGYSLASYRPIRITAKAGTDLTNGKDCSSIVYRMSDVVINSTVIRVGNYFGNLQEDYEGDIDIGSAESIRSANAFRPNSEDYQYLVPHVVIPDISPTAGYYGRYNVIATITDEWGDDWELNYSIPIDTRGSTTDTFVPFLPMSIFDSYGKIKGEMAYNIGMSKTVVLNDYYGYLDIDYYEFEPPAEPSWVDVWVEFRNGSYTRVEQFMLTDYIGQTFGAWLADNIDLGNNIYVDSSSAGIEITYTSGIDEYKGFITDGTDNVTSQTVIKEGYTYTCSCDYYVVDELMGTWLLNDNISFTGINSFYSLDGSNLFSSNGIYYSKIGKSKNLDTNLYWLDYSNSESGVYNVVYYENEGWVSSPWKTIDILIPKTDVYQGDNFLTWLKANGTKVANASSVAVVADPIPKSADISTTSSNGEWVKVEGTEYGRSAMLTLPLWDTSHWTNLDNADYKTYSFPTFEKYLNDVQRDTTLPTDIQLDYTSWIGTATAGFLNMELMPNFSIGGVLAILIGFSIVMLFLKYFAGG